MADQPRLYNLMAHADERRERLRQHAIDGLRNVFPIVDAGYVLDVEEFDVSKEKFSPSEQKRAILEGKTLVEPLKGTLVLKEEGTGKVLDRSKRTLLHLPYFTERHTFVMGGNDYTIANQVRIKPGVYTRRRENGQLESNFNLGRGRNFRLSMDPERGIIFQEYGSTKIPLVVTLRALGMSDAQISRAWGKELYDLNNQYAAGKEQSYLAKLHEKVVPSWKRDAAQTEEEKKQALREALEDTQLDPSVTEITLGTPFGKVEPAALLRASKKLLDVYQGKERQDDRDSLAFKTLHTAETFVKERIEKDAGRDVNRKVKTKLRRSGYKDPKIKDVLPSAPFTKSVHSFFTQSALSATPMQINPMEIIDSSVKVTALGEGGISSTLAVPDEARDVHGSHLGILDPVRTPESGKAGVDVRATIHMARDDDGNMYAPLVNKKTGKAEYVRADELLKKRVAFPNQNFSGRKNVDVLHLGQVKSVRPSDVDYVVASPHSMYSPTTNLVPFLESAQGNRNVMGAKMQTQALPLKERENPLVQVASWTGGPKNTVEAELGKLIIPVSPVDGTVEKVDGDFIWIRPNKGTKTAAAAAAADDLVKIPIANMFPMMSKTYVHDEVRVKPGDSVRQGQVLGDNNFTRDGKLALGKNLSVAYMPLYGWNSNDAVVISESASRKMTSLHMYKETLPLDTSIVLGTDKHKAYYGPKYNASQYAKLDTRGMVRQGAKVDHGDLLVAALRQATPTARASMLGKLHKSLVKPYDDAALTWTHESPGEIVDVVMTGDRITVTVKTEEPMRVGDKLSGRYGNKGVVSKIVPDDQMVRGESGDPIDVVMTSAGVITRINPSQILETAVSKVAKKTGEPVVVPPFADRDNVKWAKDLLKQHGLSDKETVVDPLSGKEIPNIHVGNQYIFKLFKSTETNFAGRAIGPGYDSNLQPSKGGDEGAKSIGKMEFNALLAHNARNVLKETATVKGQRNDEYWRRVQLGLPTPSPTQNFAFDKFQHMLTGAGVKINKDGTRLSLAPLTDRDVDALAPQTVRNALLVKPRTVRGLPQIVPEKGGLFDPGATGGLDGDKYSKIELVEPIVNPVFHDPARRLLEMSGKEFDKVLAERGAAWIKEQLNQLDLDAEEKRLLEQARNRSGSTRDDAVKRVKYIRALKKENLRPGDAYVMSKVPVVPPKIRPIIPNRDGTTLVSDANYLYRDLMLANEAFRDLPEPLRTPEELASNRRHLQQAVTALYGLGDPVSPQNQGRGVKGHLAQITGTSSPKGGFFQSKLMSRRQDLSGRGTIAPDHTLDMDQVGLPEDMGWKMYEPFLVRRLVQQGYPAIEARQKVKEKAPVARMALEQEIQQRPVMFNRAPTLHRYNMISAFPKLIPGKTVRLNPFAERGMNADYDGDAVQLHVPVSDAATAEAKGMTLSNLIFGDRSKDDLMVFPAHEALIGAYLATREREAGPPRKFKNKAEAMAAYKRGEITMATPVQIGE